LFAVRARRHKAQAEAAKLTSAKHVEAVFNFQKKRTPWEDVAWGDVPLVGKQYWCVVGSVGRLFHCVCCVLMAQPPDSRVSLTSSAIVDHVPPVVSAAGAVQARTLSKRVLTWRDPRGRPCQPVVVLATLVNRTPNLGGLARTCEVFRAETLVVHDLAVRDDSQFRSLSVSAYEWTHMDEQPEARLLEYIQSKKADGYTVVGLEQAQNSVALEHAVFPEKIVLVLGREKEGVPVEVGLFGMLKLATHHISLAFVGPAPAGYGGGNSAIRCNPLVERARERLHAVVGVHAATCVEEQVKQH
jgi:tRNA(Leu) C34 or U34 (ribose-2'-O)-methylase TrmL